MGCFGPSESIANGFGRQPRGANLFPNTEQQWLGLSRYIGLIGVGLHFYLVDLYHPEKSAMGGSLLLTVLFVGAALLLVNSNETTAVAAFVLQRGDRFPELVNGSLTFLIKQKDGAGRFTPNPK